MALIYDIQCRSFAPVAIFPPNAANGYSLQDATLSSTDMFMKVHVQQKCRMAPGVTDSGAHSHWDHRPPRKFHWVLMKQARSNPLAGPAPSNHCCYLLYYLYDGNCRRFECAFIDSMSVIRRSGNMHIAYCLVIKFFTTQLSKKLIKHVAWL